MGSTPQPRKTTSLHDCNVIARTILEAISNNSMGALGGDIIAFTMRETGYEEHVIFAIFETLAEEGFFVRSMTDTSKGLGLTDIGKLFCEHYDMLMPDQ